MKPKSALTVIETPPGEILPVRRSTSAFDLQAAEGRASSVQATFESVCVKLAELTPQIIEVRQDFKDKPKAVRIAGCLTWTDFCSKRLHRTYRAVQKLLTGKPQPEPDPQPQPGHELSSCPGESIRREHDGPPKLERLPQATSTIITNIEATAEEKQTRVGRYLEAVQLVDADLASLWAAARDVLALSAPQFEKVKDSFRDFHKKIHDIEQEVEHLRKTGTMSDEAVA